MLMKVLRWICCVPVAFIAYNFCLDIMPHILNLLSRLLLLWSKIETIYVPGADAPDVFGIRDWLLGWIVFIIEMVLGLGVPAFVYGFVGSIVAPKDEETIRSILLLGSFGILTILSIWLQWNNSEEIVLSIVFTISMLISVFLMLCGSFISKK